MKRRAFLTLLGGAAALPLGARAQTTPVIGFLNNTTPESYAPFVGAFRNGLRQVGYVEGQNVAIEFRWGRNGSAPLPELAAELVKRPAAVIVASGGDQAVQAVRAATKTIPIVATIGNDPVESGLVGSLNRPGGNITGVSVFAVQLVAKRLQLARELLANGGTVAFLANPNNANSATDRKELEEAARTLGQPITVLEAATGEECDVAFASLARQRIGALIVESDPYFNGIVERLVALAARHSVSLIYPRREFTIAGGLMSYGTSLTEAYRQTGIYAGRILKGDRPAEMPILLPARFELVINLKAARALGVEMPTSILLRADEVIE